MLFKIPQLLPSNPVMSLHMWFGLHCPLHFGYLDAFLCFLMWKPRRTGMIMLALFWLCRRAFPPCVAPVSTLQSWADAFRSTPSLGGVVHVYDDLRKRGLEFPMTDLDALSPIHTPNRVRRPRLNSAARCGCFCRQSVVSVSPSFCFQSIPDNEAPETTPTVSPAPQPQPQTRSSAPTQYASPAVQPSGGPVALSAEQVLLSQLKCNSSAISHWFIADLGPVCPHVWNTGFWLPALLDFPDLLKEALIAFP